MAGDTCTCARCKCWSSNVRSEGEKAVRREPDAATPLSKQLHLHLPVLPPAGGQGSAGASVVNVSKGAMRRRQGEPAYAGYRQAQHLPWRAVPGKGKVSRPGLPIEVRRHSTRNPA